MRPLFPPERPTSVLAAPMPAVRGQGAQKRSSSASNLSSNGVSVNGGAQRGAKSKIRQFFSKGPFRQAGSLLRRTRSTSKLEQQQQPVIDDASRRLSVDGFFAQHDSALLRMSMSTENLSAARGAAFVPQAIHSIDLSERDVCVLPMHASIAGNDRCFSLLSRDEGRTTFQCSSRAERDFWVRK